MGKNKKRGRTQKLYDAARKAQKDNHLQKGTNALLEVSTESSRLNEDNDDHNNNTANASPQQEVTDKELQQVNNTLAMLTSTPQKVELFRHSKRFKELRRVIHPLVLAQIKAYDKGTDYKAKATIHIAKKEYNQALAALHACRDMKQMPKQGTLQRWVRDMDTCPEGSMKIQILSIILTLGEGAQCNENIHKGLNKHDPKSALLQAQTQKQQKSSNSTADGNNSSQESDLIILDSWKIPEREEEDTEEKKSRTPTLSFSSTIIYQEKADERTPPNHYNLLLHYASPSTSNGTIIPFENNDSTRSVVYHSVPFVSGAMILQNVLSPQECRCLIQAATTLGYRPDHPKSLSEPTGIDSCEWLVNDAIHSTIFKRVKSMLPPSNHDILPSKTANKSQKFTLYGINQRWRFFRYGQGCIYRPHIDGSWPESRLSTCGNEYETDKSGQTKSFLTFLIYLNEDFCGGATRFYLAKGNGGGMVARGIKPQMGSVLVFPQGNSASLLHEGTAVSQGAKYVIRTDVLYNQLNGETLRGKI